MAEERRGILISAGKFKDVFVVPDEFTGRDIKDFRGEFGFAPALVFMDNSNADLDVLAGLVWLVERKRKRDLTLDDVLDEITYENVDADWGATDPSGDDDPEG